MKTIQNKILVTVLISIALVIIGGGAFAYVYLSTDTFRTPQELFAKYLILDLQEIGKTINLEKIEQIEEKLKQNKYEENMIISYDDSRVKMTVDTQNDAVNKKKYQSFSILTEALEEPLQIEYMLENEIHSLRFTEVVKQFLTIENRDLKKLAINLGMDEETIDKIPDTIYLDDFPLEKLNFTEEEKNKEVNKYANVLYSSIPTEKYIKNKDAVITLNGKTIKTNAYVLTLNEQDLKDIVIRLLETLKQDEIILEKIQIIDDMTQKFRDEESLQKVWKEVFSSFVQEIIDQMNSEEGKEETSEPENTVISIYEENGNTVRIKLEQGLDSITIDTTPLDNQKQIDINYTSIDTDNTQKSIKATIFRENENKLDVKYTYIDGEEQHIIQTSKEISEQDNNIKIDYSVSTENTNSLLVSRNINFVDEINYKITLDSSNNYILNDKTSEQITNTFNVLGPRITTQYIEPLKPILLPILQPIVTITATLSIFNQAQESIFNTNLSEAEIAKFNSKFLNYEGYNISRAEVNELLNIVLKHNQEEANQLTERYVTVTGDIILESNATSVPRVDGEKRYKVKPKKRENGLIYEMVITEASEDSNESLGNNTGPSDEIVQMGQDVMNMLNSVN